MLVPLSWLREFTPYEGTAQALGDKLTMLGLELEEIVNPFVGLSDIKVGYVADCSPHPDSDHMHCCKVDLGDGSMTDIVCGAPNVAQGQKVAVAPVGAKLPDGLVIKNAKLRGQPSFGMICSERELGLSEDHTGIMVLPDSAVVGMSLVNALELDTEVLDISITPNRADCLSILGIARETAMAFSLPLQTPELPLVLDTQEPEIVVPVAIDDPDRCWLYSGRVITGATVGPSPLRMRCRLHAVGVRAISNIVDITNYILFETGQPLHSFDLDKLADGKIVVRVARAGETLVTLDGRQRELTASDLCICDTRGPVGLAGVMGGQNSEIGGETKNIFLESAVFQPQTIRKTARRLGINSEASYRFERGIDQRRTIWALDRACALMASLSGGLVRRGFACAEPRPFIPTRIAYKPLSASALLGVNLADDFQRQTLESLGCSIESGVAGQWQVIQPSWRPDLTRTADVIEEIGRVYGLDAIEPVLPPVRRKIDDTSSRLTDWDFWRQVKHWAAGLGLNEVVNYSFTAQKDLDLLGCAGDKRIQIMNPLSEEQNVLRPCLAPGLLVALNNNLAYGSPSVKLFELANVFAPDAKAETGASEQGRLGIILCGERHERSWPPSSAEFDYADIKGLVESLAHFLHLSSPRCSAASDHPRLSPCVSVEFGDRFCGHMGRVKPVVAREYNARSAVWMAELSLDALKLLHEERLVSFRPLPVYPAVRRDITVAVGAGVQAGQVLTRIESAQCPLLESAYLADSFADGDGRRLTFRLIFRHGDRTLKDAEVDKERDKIAQLLNTVAGFKV